MVGNMRKKTTNKVEDAELSPKSSAGSSPESERRQSVDAPFKEIEALAFQSRKEKKHRRNEDEDGVSVGSAAETLMSKHVLNMGFYAINMGECDPRF